MKLLVSALSQALSYSLEASTIVLLELRGAKTRVHEEKAEFWRGVFFY